MQTPQAIIDTHHFAPRHQPSGLSRRQWLQCATAGLAGYSSSGWLQTLAADAAAHPDRRRSVILLWMTGGPSQMDTFDLKPRHANGGPFQAIETSVPGVRISEHLPQLARQMQDAAVIRSMSTKEGDHSRATYLLRTGYLPQGPIHYPTLGSLLSKELRNDEAELPNFVSIAPNRFLSPAAYGPGFLGPKHAPLIVGGPGVSTAGADGADDYERALRVRNLALPGNVTVEQADARLELLKEFEDDFLSRQPGISAQSHQAAYRQAVRMMRSEAVGAFNLEGEDDALRDAYGRNQFGQGCLLARRLVERGVPFVEVSLNGVSANQSLGWDTHTDNFEGVKQLSEILDPGWATLLDDLRTRGLLESTLVVWMGEFGRTPRINQNQGRDHYPNAWTTVLCGGGVRGGQCIGATSADGMNVTVRPVSVPDLLATICKAVGIDPLEQNMSNAGRPIRIVDLEATPITELLSDRMT
jgi:hypothetical protein